MAGKRMTMERAKLILDFVVQYHTLNEPSRARSDIYDWVGLKLSCGRLAASRAIDKAQRMVGLDPWNQAVAAATTARVDPREATKPVRPEPPPTPETDKAKRQVTQHLHLLDFLRWLDARGRLQHLNPWNPEDWIGEFTGIDMDALTVERKAVLDYSAAMHRYWSDLEAWRQKAGA